MLKRPATLFGRESEWLQLSEFVEAPGDQNHLAIVLGRRRQGKSMLVRNIADAANGFYFEAAQQSSAQNLADFSRAWANHFGVVGLSFGSWAQVVEHLADSKKTWKRPFTIAIDEFGYLLDSAPELPSLLQRLFTERGGSGIRMVLCGSAFAQMRRLLGPSAPLRGRQHRTIQINPFDYRTSAAFWGLANNPDAAFRLHALVGGTPAYRRFTTNGPVPGGDIDEFVVHYLLEQSSALYREGRVVVSDDGSLEDKGLYWSVLNAVAEGASRRSEIASSLGRADTALHVPIEALVAASLLEKRPDPFHRRASTLVLTEPMLRTERILLAPERARIERGRQNDVWEDSQPRVARRIYGPHLGWMAAEWVLSFASRESVGGEVRSAGTGLVSLNGERSQIDVVAVAPDRNDVERICAIGGCKAGAVPIGTDELDRLDMLIGRLGSKTTEAPKRLLFGRTGFTAELKRLARRRDDVELIDLKRLYTGT